MSMNHHGEVFAEKCYSLETLSVILGFKDVRTVRSYLRQGLRGRKVGASIYITGADFIRWVERGDECLDEDDSDGNAA